MMVHQNDAQTAESERASAESPSGGPVMVLAADVQPRAVEWLWLGRIPLGKITVLDGDPGLGKSLLTADLAACVSTGRPRFGEPDGLVRPPSAVVLLSAEDDLADTIRPRLDAARADVRRVSYLEAVRDANGSRRPVTLFDIEDIRLAITSVQAALLVIDPLAAFLDGKTNAHRDSDMRRLLAPLASLAAETGAAIVLVRHLRKAGASSAVYAGGGSIGIIGASRSGLLATADPDDPAKEQRLLAATKANLATTPATLAYRIVPANGVARIEWLGESSQSADELVRAETPRHTRAPRRDEAMEFLQEQLDDGPRPVVAIRAAAERAGIAWATIRRARKKLGVEKDNKAGEWLMRLPRPSPAPDCNVVDAAEPTSGGDISRPAQLPTRAGSTVDAPLDVPDRLTEEEPVPV